MRSRMDWKSRGGTATSAVCWKIMYRACVTTFARILMSFLVVPACIDIGVHCFTDRGGQPTEEVPQVASQGRQLNPHLVGQKLLRLREHVRLEAAHLARGGRVLGLLAFRADRQGVGESVGVASCGQRISVRSHDPSGEPASSRPVTDRPSL